MLTSDQHDYFRAAEAQCGLVTLDQLLESGLSDAAIRRLVRKGRLERILPRVFRVTGSPRSHEQRLMAQLLYAGPTSALSHRSAARLWRWDPFRDAVHIEVSVERDLRNVPGVHFYRSSLSPNEVGVLGRFRVTSPIRTIIDLAAVSSEEELEIALDCGMVRSRLNIQRIRDALHQRGTRGRKGAGYLEQLVALRAEGRPLGSSPLEVRFLRFLRRRRLPHPVSQYPIHLEGRKFLLDFAYPELRLAIETDGYRWHANRLRFESDRDKGNALTLAQWRLLRITDRHMAREQRLYDQLRRALGQQVLV